MKSVKTDFFFVSQFRALPHTQGGAQFKGQLNNTTKLLLLSKSQKIDIRNKMNQLKSHFTVPEDDMQNAGAQG